MVENNILAEVPLKANHETLLVIGNLMIWMISVPELPAPSVALTVMVFVPPLSETSEFHEVVPFPVAAFIWIKVTPCASLAVPCKRREATVSC